MKKEKQVPEQTLEINPDWMEQEIALVARHGDERLRVFLVDASNKLAAKRTRIERLLPGRSIGNNFAISQLGLVLAKIGYGDPGSL